MPDLNDVVRAPPGLAQLFPSLVQAAGPGLVMAPPRRSGHPRLKRKGSSPAYHTMVDPPKRRKKHHEQPVTLQSDLPLTGPGFAVYRIDDLMFHIMSFCTMASLVAISHADRDGRDRLRQIIRIRMKVLLVPAIPVAASQEVFFRRLQISRAAIYGSIPFFLYNPLLDISEFPSNDVTIIIPKGYRQYWVRTLREIGFVVTRQKDVHASGRCFPGASSAVRYWRASNDISFLIIESLTTNIIATLCGSTLITSQMNMLTASRLYCLYPKLAAERVTANGYTTAHTVDIQEVIKLGYTYHHNTSDWDKPCGTACGAVWRRAKNLKGIGTLSWGGYSGSMDIGGRMTDCLADGVEGTRIKWKIGSGCSNKNCPNCHA
ncbi:hypothetical protein FPV67DRAFT_1459170 [Lyophyllum atratum]|nr:hypothetical protein FPV67DRAFT_1459170 [Lyophyllum atratum]